MRILDEWSFDTMRLTVMIMNGRYSLKVEDKLMEQTYKFRDGQIRDLSHLKKLMTEDFYKTCKASFLTMESNRAQLFKSEDSEESFIELI